MKNYNEYFIIPATPSDVYAALTNPVTIRLWTGEEAEMSTEPGSEFSLWEGAICGKNLEFEENKKLVQEWYFGEQEEKSIVTILALVACPTSDSKSVITDECLAIVLPHLLMERQRQNFVQHHACLLH